MGSPPRFPGWLLGSWWDSPRNCHWVGILGAQWVLLSTTDLDSAFPKALGCNYHLLPALPPCKGGTKWSLAILWSPSERGGNSESAAVVIQASHLFFGHDSHLSHFDLTASCPPAFHCLWSRGCSLSPDIPTCYSFTS